MLPSALSFQVADVLAFNLEAVFPNFCVQRYGGEVTLTRVEHSNSPASMVTFRIERGNLSPLWAHFSIRHAGGNVYDVQGTMKDGPSRSFTYSLPEPAPLRMPKAPHLAHQIASFLLDALERRVGRDCLRANLRSGSPERSGVSPMPPRL